MIIFFSKKYINKLTVIFLLINNTFLIAQIFIQWTIKVVKTIKQKQNWFVKNSKKNV